MIYMDNAATTMHKPQEVIDAVVNAMNSMGNAGRGASEAALSASRVIYDTRDRLAELFGAEDARRIAFTSNSTESLNIAIKGSLNPGDHVINKLFWNIIRCFVLYMRWRKNGVELSIIRCDEKGMPDISQMKASIKRKYEDDHLYKWIESYRKLCRCISHREDGACTWTDVCGRRISDSRGFPD